MPDALQKRLQYSPIRRHCCDVNIELFFWWCDSLATMHISERYIRSKLSVVIFHANTCFTQVYLLARAVVKSLP